ncbi:DNA-directed DNA polymerase gamma mip1 [Oleoguttula sp. CCFEE 5521]
MALQVADIWTRAMLSQQMGIDDLPQSCTYFSAVDLDHVLRKEVNMDCVTPSRLNAITPGESVDILQLLAKGEQALLDPAIKPLEPSEPDRSAYEHRRHGESARCKRYSLPSSSESKLKQNSTPLDDYPARPTPKRTPRSRTLTPVRKGPQRAHRPHSHAPLFADSSLHWDDKGNRRFGAPLSGVLQAGCNTAVDVGYLKHRIGSLGGEIFMAWRRSGVVRGQLEVYL